MRTKTGDEALRVRRHRDMIELRIVGDPAPKGSKTVGRYGQMYDDAGNYRAWKAAIEELVWEAKLRRIECLPDVPLYGEATFYIARPKTVARDLPSVPPDLSKLIRAIEDPLIGVLIPDDSRIVRWVAEKRYADDGEPPGAIVTIRASTRGF